MAVWPYRRDARLSPSFIQNRAVPGSKINTDALPRLQRGGVEHASSLVPLADGRMKDNALPAELSTLHKPDILNLLRQT
jgi:hypothetical protein